MRAITNNAECTKNHIEVGIREGIEKRTYKGTAKEFGGTSIKGTGASPAIKWLVSKGIITTGMTVLDYGAGKYGRNAKYLKEIGCEVYTYDPYNGTDSDGWCGVSTMLPKNKDFDIGFTSFVLNVVPSNIEDDIISELDLFCRHSIHITRNMDIYDTIKKSLERKNKAVVEFFTNEYADNDDIIKKLHNDELSKVDIMDFCEYGSITSKSPPRFQRIPDLSNKGFDVIQTNYGFKIYRN